MDQLHRNLPAAQQAAEISRFVVRRFAETVGRGPTKARAYLAEDAITVVLRDTLTKPERLLFEQGHAAALTAARTALQDTLRQPALDGVELITDRTVESVHIDHQLPADIVALVFVLARKVGSPSATASGAAV